MDKKLAQDFKSIQRPFSRIEAMFSYTLDIENGREGSIAGYAVQWGWSRNKVRRFINCIRTEAGHKKDRKRTEEGHPIHFIDKGLWVKEDRRRTEAGQKKDRSGTLLLDPKSYNPKEEPPNPPKKTKNAKKKAKTFAPPDVDEVIQFFIDNGYTEDAARKAHAYYQDNDWKDSRNNPVKSWKQKMRGVWFKDENRASADKHNNYKERNYVGTPENEISWLQN